MPDTTTHASEEEQTDAPTQPPAQQDERPPEFQRPPLDMRWASAPTERPPLPKDFGPEGFTLRKADAGSYGWAPDVWPYRNDTPRGAWPAAEAERGLVAPYTIYEKAEVWADNAADLYELAIRERWAPATEISWGSIEPLAEHTEAALDQIFHPGAVCRDEHMRRCAVFYLPGERRAGCVHRPRSHGLQALPLRERLIQRFFQAGCGKDRQ